MKNLITRIEQEIDMAELNELCENLRNALRELLTSCGMYFRIFCRVKSAASIAKKIKQGHYGTVENPKKIQDLIGLRIILYYYDDLSICRNIMENTFQIVGKWSRSRYSVDEFRATKINGVFRFPDEYFGLRRKSVWRLPIDTTFEIQFRTVFFEGWHEIEHDMRYKSHLSDDEFWEDSVELSRILNCILANLELSDWSLVQLFDQLSYNHYKNRNWELMLKSKFRIKMDDNSSLDERILAVFDRDKTIAKEFFKAPRQTLMTELLKLDHPRPDYNLIVKLLNKRVVHNPEIAEICDSLTPAADDRYYQKNTLSRLDTHTLFQLELPLLHRENRELKVEFLLAAAILYKWARFKMNPVFENIPTEPCSYSSILPGYEFSVKYEPEHLMLSVKIDYIDSQSPGTIWHIYATIGLSEAGTLSFSHLTRRNMPRGISQPTTFARPSYLTDLSNRVGITDIVRLGTKAVFITSAEQLEQLHMLVTSPIRALPVVIITQFARTADNPLSHEKYGNYDMDTFTINGTRLAKVIGYYCHVYMIDLDCVADFADMFSLTVEDAAGCICIFWADQRMELFTRKTVLETQFDFNRFAFHDGNVYEKAFRHKLVQMIKKDNIS